MQTGRYACRALLLAHEPNTVSASHVSRASNEGPDAGGFSSPNHFTRARFSHVGACCISSAALRVTPLLMALAEATHRGRASVPASALNQLQDTAPVCQSAHLPSAGSSPTIPGPTVRPDRPERKRSRGSGAEHEHENERPPKHPARCARHRPEPPQARQLEDKPERPLDLPQEPPLLSEKDSQSLQSVFDAVMASTASSIHKRTASRTFGTQSDVESDQTPRSTKTNGNNLYRSKVLTRAKIHFHATPPADIETMIQSVINNEHDRAQQGRSGLGRAELVAIAGAFRAGCLKNVLAQTGEDDFLRPLRHTIQTLDLKKLAFREKSAWRDELKPVIQKQTRFSLNFMARIRQPEGEETDDCASGRASPRKRQETEAHGFFPLAQPLAHTPISPRKKPADLGTMPPPAAVPNTRLSPAAVKTPRPDIFLGIDLDGLTSALASRGLEDQASEYIEWLQDATLQREPHGPVEPVLIMAPAALASDLTFPFLIVEGKSYSTGRQIFEAENQAAVAVTCAHKILLDLDELALDGSVDSAGGPLTSDGSRLDESVDKAGRPHTSSRVLFSITTQGPIHELWAQWTLIKGGVRHFDSKLVNSWNALVPERAEDFICKLNNICAWGTGPFLDSVVEKLGRIARHAKAG